MPEMAGAAIGFQVKVTPESPTVGESLEGGGNAGAVEICTWVDTPILRPWTLSSSTPYITLPVGADCSTLGGRRSSYCTGTRCGGFPFGIAGGAGSLPTTLHCVAGEFPGTRQICVGPTRRMMRLSVKRFGGVQRKVTRSPLRLAERSSMGRGSSSEGGCGEPGWPQE